MIGRPYHALLQPRCEVAFSSVKIQFRDPRSAQNDPHSRVGREQRLNDGQVLEQLMAGEFRPNVWRLAVSRSSPAMYHPVIIEEDAVQATLNLRFH